MRNAHFDRTQDHRCHSEPLPPIPLTAQEQATLGILRDFPRSTGTIRYGLFELHDINITNDDTRQLLADLERKGLAQRSKGLSQNKTDQWWIYTPLGGYYQAQVSRTRVLA